MRHIAKTETHSVPKRFKRPLSFMEDDNEILDWGNEDDEHHEALRKPSSDSSQRDTGELDAEDSISLGDEDEDNQKYLSYRSEGTNGRSSNARDITESQLRASTPQETLLTPGAKQDSQHFFDETTREKLSTPRQSGSTEDSPHRKQDSKDRVSPQWSQLNPGRLTHALPPKPITTKVPPYLPPSHPSIVEATSMIISPRSGGRETKKSNGVSSGTSIPSTADELPHNWEYREARNGGGRYYYNKETHLSTWERPLSSVPSSGHAESRSQRRRSLSTGRRHRTPSDSNSHQSQTAHPSRNSTHMLPPDREMDDGTKAATGPKALSYEDRHYRPGESSFAAVEIRTTERLSEVVNTRFPSQSRYDRMPPASPPSRKRARSSSPREHRGAYLHEKDKEYHSSRGNSHSAHGQNAYTNDPQRDFETMQPDPGYADRWVRSPHHLDFPRSDRDSSRRHGRQHDEPMADEHDSRNRSSLRQRESNHEPNRNRDPLPSELREDANQSPVFLSAPRRGSSSHARDRDQYYSPMVRDYRAPPEEDPSTAPSSRRDRSLRHDRPTSPAISPSVNIPRGLGDRDFVPSSNLTRPSRRVSEREYDRSRGQQFLERDELPRRPTEYPPSVNQIPEWSKRRHDHEPSRPHLSDLDRLSPDYVGQSSHRKRVPLPPQAATFLTSSIAPAYTRDPPSHSAATPVAPRSHRLPDISGPDGISTLAPPPHLPGDSYSEIRDFGRSRQEPSGMKEERMDRYSRPRSKSRGRASEYMRLPVQPSSGTNNIPIGNRKLPTPSMPPLAAHAASSFPLATGYNPDARPPPSTLIDPVKARELLPPGKESYERPADLEFADTSQSRTTNDASIHINLRHSETSERQLALPPATTAPGKPRQRKSRFGNPVTQLEPRSSAREPSPTSDKVTKGSQSDASERRAATPPPVSREPSMVTSMERLSSRLSDSGQPSDAHSDFSNTVPVYSDTRTHPPAPEQPDQPLLNRFSKDPTLYEHSLPEKQSQHDHVLSPSVPGNAPASLKSGHRSGNHWSNDGRGNSQSRTLEQPQEHNGLPLTAAPTSLSHRLSDDKQRHRQSPSGGPMSGRDENSRGEVELSFHKAHTEFERESEEGMAFRLERPQAQRRGASLLDRLSTGNSRSHDPGAQQSLRDRIIPSKRELDDMMEDGMREVLFDGEDGTEPKRARRKGGRARTRGGRRGPP